MATPNAETETFDGAIWTVVGETNSKRQFGGVGGNLANAITFGGSDDSDILATTEKFHGSVWVTSTDMNSAAEKQSSTGIISAALSIGGFNSTVLAGTEAYIEFIGRHVGIAGIDSGALFNGNTLIGDQSNGKIYKLDMNTYTEDGNQINRVRRAQIINKERVNVIHNRIEVEFESGVGLDVEEGEIGENPQATLKWSDDGGNTWSDGLAVSMGQYQDREVRAIWRRLGKSRNRIYQLEITDPVKVVIIGAYADLKPCKF